MIYWDGLSSIFRFCNEFIDEVKGEGISPNLGFLYFDAHADVHEMPSYDVIGPAAFTMDTHDRIHSVSCSIGVSPFNDVNLGRHNRILAKLYDALAPETKIPLLDHSRGVVTSWMVVRDGTSVMPSTRAETRPFQFVQFSALLNPAVARQ